MSLPAFEVQSRKELLTPVLLNSQLSHKFSTLVPFRIHLSSNPQPELPKFDFRLPPARGSPSDLPTRVSQLPLSCTGVPYEHRWCPGISSTRTPRLRMNGLVHSSIRTRPVFFRTSGPRAPSRFHTPGSRLDCKHRIDRDPVVARSDRPYVIVRPCTCPNTLPIWSRTWAHPAVCHIHLLYFCLV